LIKAKKELDKVLIHLSGYQEFWDEAKALREKILNLYIEEEKRLPGLPER
jgi:hypothetical protein